MVVLDATDAAWEVERLVSFLTNVDSRTGGLIFFYDDKGNRSISEVSGPILPVFKGTKI
jgi:methane/ammonia monooxygenase subunit B